MSMISEQIEELRLMAEMFVNGEPYGNLLRRAADTIEMLSEKVRADRPQGEWIAVDSYSAFGGSEEQWNAHGNPIAYHYCSNCKSQTRVDEFGEEMLTDYCPNCGARMKGAGYDR